MIRTLMHVNWINLKRDRVALGLIFVLPIVFFSIFAMIFGGMSSGSGGGSGSIRVVVVDEDATDVSARFAEAIDAQDALRIITAPRTTEDVPEPAPYDREAARRAIRSGDHPVAVIIPEGFGDRFGTFTGDQAEVELIYDAANPIALNTVGGLLQAASFMAAPDVLMEGGFEQLELAGGFLTDEQRDIIDRVKPALRGEVSWDSLDEDADTDEEPIDADADGAADTETASGLSDFQGFITVNATDARAGDDEDGEENGISIVTYYAAAIGVMFLLFSMAGASSSILEDEERGTLERLLSSRLNMGTLLFGHWVFFSVVGVAQLVFMFLWGEFVFGIELFTMKHLAGFIVMAVFTAAAAASFGLFLATICRSRAQLNGISTIVILIMSALGGSMVPRMVAPFIEQTSRFTFNGWALDGFLKVFWHDDPSHTLLQSLAYLWPQLVILTAMTAVLLFISRRLARRWEAV